MGAMFLILVDAHSKWLDIHIVNSATSLATIEKMRSTFATHGLPEVLVTDNGSVFTSAEFADFAKQNGIRHVFSAPYHPASNGLAERAVQTFKEGMRKSRPGSLETRLARFLFKYRITPHSTTGLSPAELLMGRRLHSHLSQLHPDVAQRVEHHQEQQKLGHDHHSKVCTFKVGDPVFARNFGNGPTWLPGLVQERRGPLSCLIELVDGRVIRRHMDHTRHHSVPLTESDDSPVPLTSDNFMDVAPAWEGSPTPVPGPEPWRSGRLRRPPNRYM